ncbi:MAG: class I SAM-dependent methyltransferase, partial [Deltaproteobacteria bacterium]|nr:class I SAM-dependent methyltransferase [Deltaproteobacteria bacterium]
MRPRHLDDLIPLSRRALASALARAQETEPLPLAVDATAGNGHDTLFLASAIGERGHVWAFDVQEAALASARARVEAAGFASRVSFALSGHETLSAALPEDASGRVWAAAFNLGFLPGSDKTVTTRAENTLAALKSLAVLTAPGGVLSVHAYAGHKGGEDELRAVNAWFAGLGWDVWRVAGYSFINKIRNRET